VTGTQVKEKISTAAEGGEREGNTGFDSKVFTPKVQILKPTVVGKSLQKALLKESVAAKETKLGGSL